MKSIRWLLAAAMVAISCASMMTQAAPARMAQAAQPAAAPAQDARPAAAVVTTADVKSLSSDHYAFEQCAILKDGQVLCWGLNGYNELSGLTGNQTVPVTMSSFTDVGSLVIGEHRICIVQSDTTASCIGKNGEMFGNGTTTDSSSLTNVLEPSGGAPLTGIDQIRTSTNHTCALMTDNTVRCWGIVENGAIGNGTLNTYSIPVTVVNVSDATQIVTGDLRLVHCGRRGMWCAGERRNISAPGLL